MEKQEFQEEHDGISNCTGTKSPLRKESLPSGIQISPPALAIASKRLLFL
jgi:hypothetical protein